MRKVLGSRRSKVRSSLLQPIYRRAVHIVGKDYSLEGLSKLRETELIEWAASSHQLTPGQYSKEQLILLLESGRFGGKQFPHSKQSVREANAKWASIPDRNTVQLSYSVWFGESVRKALGNEPQKVVEMQRCQRDFRESYAHYWKHAFSGDLRANAESEDMWWKMHDCAKLPTSHMSAVLHSAKLTLDTLRQIAKESDKSQVSICDIGCGNGLFGHVLKAVVGSVDAAEMPDYVLHGFDRSELAVTELSEDYGFRDAYERMQLADICHSDFEFPSPTAYDIMVGSTVLFQDALYGKPGLKAVCDCLRKCKSHLIVVNPAIGSSEQTYNFYDSQLQPKLSEEFGFQLLVDDIVVHRNKDSTQSMMQQIFGDLPVEIRDFPPKEMRAYEIDNDVIVLRVYKRNSNFL